MNTKEEFKILKSPFWEASIPIGATIQEKKEMKEMAREQEESVWEQYFPGSQAIQGMLSELYGEK